MTVIRRSSVETVLTAFVAALKASTGVTAYTSQRVYTNVPQGTPFPYLEVTPIVDRPRDTARWGAELQIQVKAVSQALGDQENCRIGDQVIRALHFTLPTTTGHDVRGVKYLMTDPFREVINGVVTRHYPMTFEVWTEQTST